MRRHHYMSCTWKFAFRGGGRTRSPTSAHTPRAYRGIAPALLCCTHVARFSLRGEKRTAVKASPRDILKGRGLSLFRRKITPRGGNTLSFFPHTHIHRNGKLLPEKIPKATRTRTYTNNNDNNNGSRQSNGGVNKCGGCTRAPWGCVSKKQKNARNSISPRGVLKVQRGEKQNMKKQSSPGTNSKFLSFGVEKMFFRGGGVLSGGGGGSQRICTVCI